MHVWSQSFGDAASESVRGVAVDNNGLSRCSWLFGLGGYGENQGETGEQGDQERVKSAPGDALFTQYRTSINCVMQHY